MNYASPLSSTFAGVIADNGATANSLTLNNAAATLTLTGSSNFSGATTLTAGSLVLGDTAVLAGLGAVTLNGGTLASGIASSIGGALNAGSGLHYISPGGDGSIGGLSIGGSVSLNSNSLLRFDISSTSSLDQILDSGALSMSGGSLMLPAGLANGSQYKLIEYNTAGGVPAVGSLTLLGTNGATAPNTYRLLTTSDPGWIDLVVGGNPAAFGAYYAHPGFKPDHYRRHNRTDVYGEQ